MRSVCWRVYGLENLDQNDQLWSRAEARDAGVMPCLTKSTRLMRHSCGSSCIWKNIWRMLEILMQARTALRQRRRGLCPKALELSQLHSSTRCLFSSLPWADSRRRAPATTALPGQLRRRRGRPAAGKESRQGRKGNLHPHLCGSRSPCPARLASLRRFPPPKPPPTHRSCSPPS